MPPLPTEIDNLTLALVAILSFAALALTLLSPGFSAGNTLVYGGF